MKALSVGSTIWRFDGNRRVYRKPEPGQIWSHEGPIYREYWQPIVITGETSRSWIAGPYGKAPKTGQHHGWAFTEKEVEDACWLNDHRYKLIQHIERIQDAPMLRRIAEVAGFKPEPTP